MTLLRTSWAIGKWCAGCARDLLLCVLWLALAGLLTLQVFLLSAHQLPMPDWMLRQIESRLALAGFRAQIGTATIEPAGRVVLENLQLFQTTSSAPLVTIDTLKLRLAPWALLHGKVEASYVRGSGISFFLPAMLSPTGRAEAVISDVSLSFKPDQAKLTLDQLTGRLANLTFSCRGTMVVPTNLSPGISTPAQTAARVNSAIKSYISFCQRLAEIEPELQSLESPHLDLNLSPNATGLVEATITLTSRKADFDLSRLKPDAGRVQVVDLRASTIMQLSTSLPRAIRVRVNCKEAHSTNGYEVRSLLCDLAGDLAPDFSSFIPQKLIATTGSVLLNGVSLDDALAIITPSSPSSFQIEVTTRAIGTDWYINALADPKLGQGSLTLGGALTPVLTQRVEDYFGRPHGSLLKLSAPAPISLSAEFGEHWQPLNIRGRLSSGPLVGGSVPIDDIQGDISYSNNELAATDIFLHQGENRARGSYWMNTKTLDYRFLLTGQLRPPDIGGWFSGWWGRFWNHFDFAVSVPVADVTVGGRWGLPHTTTLFVGVDVTRPAIQGVMFDHVRTAMFIRPEFYDAVEIKVTKENRSAQGSFTRSVDLTRDEDALRAMDFDLTSNLDLAETAKMFGDVGSETVEPFTFANPPSLQLTGHIDGPASTKGSHRSIQIALNSAGAFALYDFPLSDLSFHGRIRDTDIDLNDVQVSFARGQAQGRAYLSGPESERRLSFDCAIKDANIGESINTLEQFFAKQRGEAPSPNSKFQRQLADGSLSLQLAAQGLYRDPLSYRGQGGFELSGDQLARINLFGALSQLLSKSSLFSFTALQLKAARASFSLDRQQLDFPDLKITGTTAAIETKGSFLLDRKIMDFSAKVYPFEQGKTLLANAVGFVLVPLSNALELRLSGTLDQPNWRFAYGPTSFIYSITGTKPSEAPPIPSAKDTPRKLPPIYLRR